MEVDRAERRSKELKDDRRRAEETAADFHGNFGWIKKPAKHKSISDRCFKQVMNLRSVSYIMMSVGRMDQAKNFCTN